MSMRKIDSSEPSAELYRKAYGLALEIFEIAPWIHVAEDQLLAVEFADGTKKFISVMGSCGMHRALAFYPDVGSYCMMNTIDESDFIGLREVFLSVSQLQLAFELTKNLQDGERDFIKQSKMKFPRGANPSFVSYVPGAMPAHVGGEELAEIVRFLAAFRDFCRTGRLAKLTTFGTSGLISTWRENATGEWTFEEDEFGGHFPIMATLSGQDFYDMFKALPVKKGLNLEVGAISLPTGEASSWRKSVARVALVVEKESRTILACKIVEPESGCETDWGVVVDALLSAIADFGVRPERLSAFGKCVASALTNLCSRELSGVPFDPLDPCTSFHEAASLLLQQFGAI